ncbi:MAG: hypothetical protein LBQ44_04400 [Treponema sp.]|jgi:hypothetical protein|nr:hypothetical protein [Treponema sp.]
MAIMQNRKQADAYRHLMAAVINRALADLEGKGVAVKVNAKGRDEAMAWVNGPECEAFCLALDMDYTALREKAAALYRRFLEDADRVESPRLGRPSKTRQKAPEKAGAYPDTFFVRKRRIVTGR